MATNSNFTFPVLDYLGNPTTTTEDFATMFVPQNLYTNNVLYAWGSNDKGQLGLSASTLTKYSSPIQVGSLTTWKQVAAGCIAYQTLSTKTDGTLWATGRNVYGQLGNNTGIQYSSPIQIGTLTNWKQVSGGYNNTAAIKTDGTLWTWGRNQYGQLGNGTRTTYSSPIQIGTLTDWSKISCGYAHVLATKTDGTLWTWGSNIYGELGNNTTTPYSSPIQIGSLTNWSQVIGGFYYSMAIKTDGTLWGWGNNTVYGQLGNGTTTDYSSPIQIGSLTDWKQVACGYHHTMAIKTDGTLWTCGYNNYGQLGNGSNSNYYSSPIQVGSLNTWKQVAGGLYHTMAIKTDGTLWGWGSDGYGELGNGNTTYYSSPIQVGSLTNWKQVTCGGNFTAAISTR